MAILFLYFAYVTLPLKLFGNDIDIVVTLYLFIFLLYVLMFGMLLCHRGRDGSFGIATRNGQDGPGIESRWGRDFPHPSRPTLWDHPASYTMGSESFPRVKRPGRGVDHTPRSSTEDEGKLELYEGGPKNNRNLNVARDAPLDVTSQHNTLTVCRVASV
jgi:hypothetical protein